MTIGELLNDIIPYSNSLEIKTVGNIPYLKASLTNGSDFNEGYLYIVQTSDNRYSVADIYDVLIDGPFIPMKDVSGNLISERDFIRGWSGLDNVKTDRNPIININYRSFINYFYIMLSRHKIIYTTEKNLNSPISSIRFSIPKIYRMLEGLCKSNGFQSTLIIDLITVIKLYPNKCKIIGLQGKHAKEIISKFKNIGITLKFDMDTITDLKLEKRSLRGKMINDRK